MTAFLGFLKAVWDWLFESAKRFMKWLKKPGSMTKVILVVLIVYGAIATFRSYSANQKIFVITAEYTKARTDWTERERGYQTAEEGFLQQQADFKQIVALEAKKLEAARAASAQAVADAEAAKKRAELSFADWMKEYDKRPASCKAALNALEAACPALQSY